MIFNNLLKLYRKGRRENSTPLEDFITELLAGVLSNDYILLQVFMNDFLGVEGNDFSVRTQKHYKNNASIIDMVFENEDTVCFVENKVNSNEGHGQLPKYSRILDELSKKGKKTKLCYCTKRYDPKVEISKEESNPHNFKQYRWIDVVNFIQKQPNYPNDILSQLFVKFLITNNEIKDMSFEEQNILIMPNIGNTILKMNHILNSVCKRFEQIFGSTNCFTQSKYRYNQLTSVHNRFIIYKTNILPKTYSDICMGFSMEDMALVFTFYMQDSDIQAYSFLKKYFEGYRPIELPAPEGKKGFVFELIRKKLDEIKSEEEIIKCFEETMQKFKELANEATNQNKDINWLFR
ncbi:MAG: PD-(D/E)XK nuclease family protein [Bacteroidia bacterium]|nr:PD-(D/E)XK nuclease family protein [Bacteroidia bacterium]